MLEDLRRGLFWELGLPLIMKRLSSRTYKEFCLYIFY